MSDRGDVEMDLGHTLSPRRAHSRSAEEGEPQSRRIRLDPRLVARHTYFPAGQRVGNDEEHESEQAQVESKWWTRLNNGASCLQDQELVLPLFRIEGPVFPGQAYPFQIDPHEVCQVCRGLPSDQLFTTKSRISLELPRVIGLWSGDVLSVGTIARVIRYASDFASEDENEADEFSGTPPAFLLTEGLVRARGKQLVSESSLSLASWALAVVTPIRDAVPNPTRGEIRFATSAPQRVHERYDALKLSKRAAAVGRRFLLPRDSKTAQHLSGSVTVVTSQPLDGCTEIEQHEQSGNEASQEVPAVVIPTTYAETVSFSYWLAANVPTCNRKDRQILFNTDDVTQRLVKCIELLENTHQILACLRCGKEQCATENVIVMSSQGSSGNFLNPQGHVHHLLTTCFCERIVLFGGPETDHSYFPGYSWTIMGCGRCMNMLGWKFDAVAPNLERDTFFALLRTNIQAVNQSSGAQIDE